MSKKSLKAKLRTLDKWLCDWDQGWKNYPNIFVELAKLDQKRKQVRLKLKEYK